MTFVKFEDMKVWQEGRELVKAVYALTRQDGFAKDWGLRDQIQRAAVSVTSNIAEGYARRGNKELLKFLWYSKGSTAEVQSQLYNAIDLGYIDQAQFDTVYNAANLIQVHLFHLMTSLSSSPTHTKPLSQPPQRGSAASQPPQRDPVASQPSQP